LAFGVGAAIEVLGKELLAARVRNEIVVEKLELLRRDLAVAFPPDGVLGERVTNGVLVLRAAAGMDAGLGTKRAALDQRGLARGKRVLVKHRCIEIPVDCGKLFETKFISAMGAVPQTRFPHGKPPLSIRSLPEIPP